MGGARYASNPTSTPTRILITWGSRYIVLDRESVFMRDWKELAVNTARIPNTSNMPADISIHFRAET